MEIPWGDIRTSKLITNVGLITSDGPNGPNIMAAEWTHQISYNPGLFAIHLFKFHATYENISASKEFGINIASVNQSAIASISGGNKGKQVDKISLLKELGAEFYPAGKINVQMLKGAAMHAECKLINSIDLGDHVMLIGEAVELSAEEKEPLAYHAGKFWNIGERIEKPQKEKIDELQKLVEKHKR